LPEPSTLHHLAAWGMRYPNDLSHDGEGMNDNLVLAPLSQFRNIVDFCPASCLPFLNLFILVLSPILGWRSLCFLGLAVLVKNELFSSPANVSKISRSCKLCYEKIHVRH